MKSLRYNWLFRLVHAFLLLLVALSLLSGLAQAIQGSLAFAALLFPVGLIFGYVVVVFMPTGLDLRPHSFRVHYLLHLSHEFSDEEAALVSWPLFGMIWVVPQQPIGASRYLLPCVFVEYLLQEKVG